MPEPFERAKCVKNAMKVVLKQCNQFLDWKVWNTFKIDTLPGSSGREIVSIYWNWVQKHFWACRVRHKFTTDNLISLLKRKVRTCWSCALKTQTTHRNEQFWTKQCFDALETVSWFNASVQFHKSLIFTFLLYIVIVCCLLLLLYK